MSNRLRTILISVVAAVWALNFSAPVFVQGYEPPDAVHVVFMAIAATLLSGYKKTDTHSDNPDQDADRLN